MNLKDVTLSYPAIRYKVNVSHLTSRHSTAMEWLILEVTRKSMLNPQLAGVAISSIFEEVFLINDANLMIKPCILALRDDGALITENIYDEADLGEVPLRNMRLTELGQRMQMDGLLPGKMSEDSITVIYDPIRQVLVAEDAYVRYDEGAAGMCVRDGEELEGVTFPSALVMEYLAEAKQKQRYRWMTQTTQIYEAAPAHASVLWKNISRKFVVSENWKCSIDGDEDGTIAANYLSNMAINLPVMYANAPDIQNLNPDTDIKQLIELTSLGSSLNNQVVQDALFMIKQSHFSLGTWNMPDRKIKGVRAAIIEGAKETSVSLTGNRMVIYLQDHLLDEGEIYRSESAAIYVGRVHLTAGEVTRDAVFAYLPVDSQNDKLFKVISVIIEKYSAKHPKLLYLLLEIGEKARFYELVEAASKQFAALADRQAFLDAINHDGIQLYSRKLLSQEQYSDMLLNIQEMKARVTDFDEIEQVISEYIDAPVILGSDDLLRNVVRTVLETDVEPRNLEELWRLWGHLRSIKKSLMSWIATSKLYSRFYASEIVEQIAQKVSFTGETAIASHTPVEAAFLEVERIIRRVLERLPELDLDTDYSSERVLECILIHRDDIAPLHSEIRNWDDAILSFEARVAPIEEMSNVSRHIQAAITLMDRLRSALSIFFDEAAVNFQRVYVADTCALMHTPELISTFSDGKSLLIIPVLVQSELDSKKEDEETSYQAREAIRQIEYYREERWLDNSQNSHPELLSPDLDPEKNDSKILSICIKYAYKNGTLITDDINLRNMASSQHIKSMDSEGYMKAKAHETSGDAGKKKKGKRR